MRKVAIVWANGLRFSGIAKMTSTTSGKRNLIKSVLFGANATVGGNQGFAALKAFKAREGHCYVPGHQVEGTVHLGHWVTVQRRERHKMSRERRQRLKEVGFVWDGRHTKAMKRKLAALRPKDRRSTAHIRLRQLNF